MNVCDQIETLRPIGKVSCSIFHGSQILPRKERLKKNGYYEIPDDFWVALDREEAKAHILNSLCHHIEDGESILNEEEVSPLVGMYVESFPSNVVFYTNYEGSYECISNSFLDIAVIIENELGLVGLICIEDNQQP